MLDFSKEEIMSRKEYLRKKNNIKSRFRIIKYVLLVLAVICLSIYVVKELKRYNTMTVLAKKVVEQAMLSKTYKIYFVGQPYTKDDKTTSLYLYTALDESREKIEGGENLQNIIADDVNVYGIQNGKLISIAKATKQITEIFSSNVVAYEIANGTVYIYVVDSKQSENTGIYVGSLQGDFNKIITGNVTQMLVDEKYIYLVQQGTTVKSLVRYSHDGKNKMELTNTEMVSYIIQDEDTIYFSNASDKGSIYCVSKNSTNVTKLTNNTTYMSSKQERWYNGNRYMAIYDNYIIYVNKDNEDKVYVYDKNTKEEKVLIDNSAQIIQARNNVIYFMIKGKIDIYRYDILKNEVVKVTSVRSQEFYVV